MAVAPNSSKVLRFGVFEADLEKRELRKQGIRIRIYDQPFEILITLLGRAGEVISREELRRKLWPSETFVDFDHSINAAVNRLREALGDSADNPRFIETLARRGYRFVAPVEAVMTGAAPGSIPAPASPGRRWDGEVLAWSLLGVAALAFAVLLSTYLPHTVPAAPPVRFEIPLPDKVTLASDDYPVLSPDGRSFVFTGHDADGRHLWIHSLDSLTTRMLPVTGEFYFPFWSPDSRFVAFFYFDENSGPQLRKLDTLTGAELTICSLKGPVAGGTWGRNGTILFAQSSDVYGVPATGGEPKRVLNPEPACKVRLLPSFLPDGRHFLYECLASEAEGAENVGSIDSKDTRSLILDASNVAYARPGFLVYGRQGTLFARPFDLKTLRLTGEASPIAQQVGREPDDRESHFSISDNGVLIYHGHSNLMQPAWYDRNGVRLGSIGEPGDYEWISLSPDDARLAVGRRDAQTNYLNIWTLELSNGISSRQTFQHTDDWYPVWSPDGHEFVFISNRRTDGKAGFYRKVVGGGDEEVLFTSSDVQTCTCTHQWLMNGSIFFMGAEGRTFYVLPLSADRKPVRLPKTESEWFAPQVSPDGAWVAYHSHESGRWDVYIASFPAFTERRQVSNAGGFGVRWSKDGNELFYINLKNELMSLDVKRGAALMTGVPRTLFKTPFVADGCNYQYSVTRDGKRFIFNEPVKEAGQPFTVVLNWVAGLR